MCVLHIWSETASFQEFLERTNLPVYQSHEKGQKKFHSKKLQHKPPHDTYGFSCNVSKKEWDNLNGQIDDALKFLGNHEKELKDLIQNYSIDGISLDFPYYCRIGNNIIVQCDYLPPELLLRTGGLNIGIELSLYPNLDSED